MKGCRRRRSINVSLTYKLATVLRELWSPSCQCKSRCRKMGTFDMVLFLSGISNSFHPKTESVSLDPASPGSELLNAIALSQPTLIRSNSSAHDSGSGARLRPQLEFVANLMRIGEKLSALPTKELRSTELRFLFFEYIYTYIYLYIYTLCNCSVGVKFVCLFSTVHIIYSCLWPVRYITGDSKAIYLLKPQ